MAAIVLESVTKRFGAVTAVESLSLAVPEGTVLTLLGPSGCGKTTTLRIIAGLVEPDGGRVLVGGRDMRGVPAHQRNIGVVFQHYGLFPHMTVFDNVAFGLRMRRVAPEEVRRRVQSAMELVRLTGLECRHPSQLSGGQQQRVALARALVIEPQVLLLDEPFGALDRLLREEMQLEFKRLQRQLGVTTLFVTHDQEEALLLSDQVCVMNRGRVVQLSSPQDLFERPRTPFVAEFVGVRNVFPGRVYGLDGRRAQVELQGRWRVDAVLDSRSLQLGEAVRVAIPPHRVRLNREPQRSAVVATLVEAVYRGPWVQCILELEGGLRLHTLLPFPAAPSPAAGTQPSSAFLRPGAVVGVDVDDGAAVILDEDEPIPACEPALREVAP